jgi:hypothetical protein
MERVRAAQSILEVTHNDFAANGRIHDYSDVIEAIYDASEEIRDPTSTTLGSHFNFRRDIVDPRPFHFPPVLTTPDRTLEPIVQKIRLVHGDGRMYHRN